MSRMLTRDRRVIRNKRWVKLINNLWYQLLSKKVYLVYNIHSGFSLGYHILNQITLDSLKCWMTVTLTNYCKRGGHPMSLQDKSLQCSDCGAAFTFTTGEQEFFASKGYTNEPKRCPSCRQTRKSERDGGGGYGDRSRRQMFPAVCAQCGEETEVPFQPREGRPVYCSNCYNKTKMSG